MKSLVFGEVLWDIYPDARYIGGAPLNFAAHLSKLGNDVTFMTGVGNDKLGDRALEIINAFGVNTELAVVVNGKETGKCYVSFDENHSPSYRILDDTACDYISVHNNADYFDVLYFGTLALRNEYNRLSIEKLLKNNKLKQVFVDINIRPPFYSDETIIFALQSATIVKISLEELLVVSAACGIDFLEDYKACAKALSKKFNNLKLVIITLGADGSYCFDRENGNEYSADCVKVPVVSTVGAGDSFSAAFLHKYLMDCDVKVCLDYASKVSAFVVSSSQTVPEYDPENFE